MIRVTGEDVVSYKAVKFDRNKIYAFYDLDFKTVGIYTENCFKQFIMLGDCRNGWSNLSGKSFNEIVKGFSTRSEFYIFDNINEFGLWLSTLNK